MGFSKIPTIRGKGEIARLLTFIKENASDDAFVCGGYVRWMCSPVRKPIEPSDVDVYCKTDEIFKQLEIAFDKLGLRKKENRISLCYVPNSSDYSNIFFGLPRIQLIKPMKIARLVSKGTMEEIIASFDFTVISLGLIDIDTALADDDFYEHEKKRQLI